MDPATKASVVPVSKVIEPSVMEWVVPMVEVTPIFQQLSVPEVSASDKGEGTFTLFRKRSLSPPRDRGEL